eukprot:scaffold6990_cov22-Tisochrysis_lutea.AAC.1
MEIRFDWGLSVMYRIRLFNSRNASDLGVQESPLHLRVRPAPRVQRPHDAVQGGQAPVHQPGGQAPAHQPVRFYFQLARFPSMREITLETSLFKLQLHLSQANSQSIACVRALQCV